MTAGHILWQVNHEYQKRLNQANIRLSLLEQLLLSRNNEVLSPMLAVLRYVCEQIEQLIDDHRRWRYRYYYESHDTRRMVQDERAVNQALARFSRMRSVHQTHLYDLYDTLYSLPRPDPQVTQLPNGDLWLLAEYALQDLLAFSDYLNELSQVY